MHASAPFAPVQNELRAMDWGQLHFSVHWVYRGQVPAEGRGQFSGACGLSAWCLLRGTGHVRQGDIQTTARKGDWLFPNRGPHCRDFSPDAEILSLRFHIEWPDGQSLFPLQDSIVIAGSKYPGFLRAAKALERAVYQGQRRDYSLDGFMNERLTFSAYLDFGGTLLQWSKALYEVLIAEGVKPSLERFEDDRLVRALRVLDAWPLHQAFSQSRLVEQASLSRAQLDRLFTAKLGQTAHQYFNRRRLSHAERLIRLPDQPIKEVAFDVGFRHVSSFSAWFKQNTGVNPNNRRESALAFPGARRHALKK